MRRSYNLIVFVLAATALLSCRSGLDLSKASTQLDVGVRAARDNLWREALFRFQRAIQIDPQNAMAQNNLAVAYEGIGEFEKARVAYTEALKLDRSNQYIQKNYSRFVEFYSKNRKREKKLEPKDEAQPTASSSPPAEAPPDQPVAVPVANPEPPQTPVTSPPPATKPDRPPNGGLH
jgi:Flp pilus assembly protein TadD